MKLTTDDIQLICAALQVVERRTFQLDKSVSHSQKVAVINQCVDIRQRFEIAVAGLQPHSVLDLGGG